VRSGRKAPRAPRVSSDKRSDDEIVAEIVEAAGDAKIEPFVWWLIDRLRQKCPPLTGNKKLNKEFATKLRKQCAALKKTISPVPNNLNKGLLLSFVFAPERFWPLWFWQETATEIDPSTRVEFTREPERLTNQLSELDRIRTACDQVLKMPLGGHGRINYQRLRAAIGSREVMERLGQPLTTSESSAYCRIASLLHEAATDADAQDLRHACEAAATNPLLATAKRPSRRRGAKK
jgi:hypothetical protein